MDLADNAADTSALFLQAEIQKNKEDFRFGDYTGFCLNCGAKVEAPLMFCEDEENGCQVDYEKRRDIRRRQSVPTPAVR